MNFPRRSDLIKGNQSILGVTPDGLDGSATWYRIGERILSSNHPSMKGIKPSTSGRVFIGRTALVSAVQARLKLTVDGDDGSETWASISEFLAPNNQPSPTPARPGKFRETVRGRSPNRNQGRNDCKGIVFHHACGYFEGTIEWCMKPGTFAGYHCLIAEDGTRAILGLDSDRLHHAGTSSWRGRSLCNHFMLGIAFVGDTNTGAMRKTKDLNPAEIASALEWVREKMRLHSIAPADLTTHRAVSPGRKDDISLAAFEQLKKHF